MADSFLPGDQYPATATTKTPDGQVASWYQQYLGRAPESQAVTDAWAGQDPATAQAGIQNSPEAKAYAAAHPNGATAQTAANTTSFTNTASNPNATPGIVINGQQVTGAGPNGPTTATGANPWTTPGTVAGGIAATPGGPAPPVFGGSSPSTPANPEYESLIQTLLSKANQDPNVSPNDPAVSAATDAYAADETRAGRQFLTQQAEKAGPYGDIGAETAHAAEVTGQQTAGYRANLVNTMTQQRMAAIQSALSGAQGLLSAQDQARLQDEYLTLQNNQFGANTAQQSWQDQYQTIFG